MTEILPLHYKIKNNSPSQPSLVFYAWIWFEVHENYPVLPPPSPPPRLLPGKHSPPGSHHLVFHPHPDFPRPDSDHLDLDPRQIHQGCRHP